MKTLTDKQAPEQAPEPTVTLDKKYRPDGFDYLYGNHATVKAIIKVIDRPQGFPSCVLLKGPSGCGKTTIARIIANLLGSYGRDFKQYNIAKMRGIDTARAIVDLTTVAPWQTHRVIVLNECHRATVDFWNTMLEVLEEPPQNNHFILCTTEPERVIKTVRTRCTDYSVKLLKSDEMEPLVLSIAEAEGAQVDEQVVRELVKAAEGSPRKALIILDAVIDLTDIDAQLETVHSYRSSEDTVAELCQSLLKKEAWKAVVVVLNRLTDRDAVEDLRRGILGYMEKVILGGGQQAQRASELTDLFTVPTYDNGSVILTQACYLAVHS